MFGPWGNAPLPEPKMPAGTRIKRIPALQVGVGHVIVRRDAGMFRVWQVTCDKDYRRVTFTVQTIPGGTLTEWSVPGSADVEVVA